MEELLAKERDRRLIQYLSCNLSSWLFQLSESFLADWRKKK